VNLFINAISLLPASCFPPFGHGRAWVDIFNLAEK
jgi:hypothetical protein